MDLPSYREYHIYSPGKCLLTGGYLILEKGNKGLSLALTAHSHSSVYVSSYDKSETIIEIDSPELSGHWVFTILPDGSMIENKTNAANPFLSFSVLRSIAVLDSNLSVLLGKRIRMTISSEGSFYSHMNDRKLVKLGLGSSSTTVVSVVCVLLLESGLIQYEMDEGDRTLVAHTASDAHNAAQGRIGSGFDVVTAVFGSCVFEKTLDSCRHTPFSLPPHVSIALSCGGSGSSETPVMVRQVKKWRETTEANELWKQYGENNRTLVESIIESEENDWKGLYEEKLEIMHSISTLSASNVIPDELYEVMKTTNTLKGVLGCIVAGAGGLDSFYCLYDNRVMNQEELKRVWLGCGCTIADVKESRKGLLVSSSSMKFV